MKFGRRLLLLREAAAKSIEHKIRDANVGGKIVKFV